MNGVFARVDWYYSNILCARRRIARRGGAKYYPPHKIQAVSIFTRLYNTYRKSVHRGFIRVMSHFIAHSMRRPQHKFSIHMATASTHHIQPSTCTVYATGPCACVRHARHDIFFISAFVCIKYPRTHSYNQTMVFTRHHTTNPPGFTSN